MVRTISSRSSSLVPQQVDDQGMRDGKGAHTIRDSCYHKWKGAVKTWGVAANTAKVRQITNFKDLHHLSSYLE